MFAMQAYLTDFLQSFSTLPYYATFSQHHTDVERQVLGVVGISVWLWRQHPQALCDNFSFIPVVIGACDQLLHKPHHLWSASTAANVIYRYFSLMLLTFKRTSVLERHCWLLLLQASIICISSYCWDWANGCQWWHCLMLCDYCWFFIVRCD